MRLRWRQAFRPVHAQRRWALPGDGDNPRLSCYFGSLSGGFGNGFSGTAHLVHDTTGGLQSQFVELNRQPWPDLVKVLA